MNNFISDPSSITPCTSWFLNFVIDNSDEEKLFDEPVTLDIPTTFGFKSLQVKIETRKSLNINPNLSTKQRENNMLKKPTLLDLKILVNLNHWV